MVSRYNISARIHAYQRGNNQPDGNGVYGRRGSGKIQDNSQTARDASDGGTEGRSAHGERSRVDARRFGENMTKERMDELIAKMETATTDGDLSGLTQDDIGDIYSWMLAQREEGNEGHSHD